MKETITIYGLNHQGEGIGKCSGKVLFVRGALPEELVTVQITKENKKFLEGKLLEIITPSSKRVASPCPYFPICGGCDLQHLSYLDQLQYKEEKVKDLVLKYGHLDPTLVKPIVANHHPLYYRNKATFQVKEKIGYYGKKNYDIIPIDQCLIVDSRMNEVLKQLRKFSLDGINQIMVRVSKKEILVQLFGSSKQDFSSLGSLVSTCLLNETLLFGTGVITEFLGPYMFMISPASFFQINTKGAELLYNLVKEQLLCQPQDVILDLYCGTGTIGIYLCKEVKQVFGVELNQSAVQDANLNKKQNHCSNIQFFEGDTGTIVSKKLFQANKVVVDPPRAGLDTKTITYLLNESFERIVYVSCDPLTLCRDLNLLKEKYQVVSIIPVDMFSQTYHVECVVTLTQHS